ncbi:MAG TPA: LUD domain-containing protein [Chryseolinea sp.]|nr:LUD domain-containing protein [Chryseolinea sp.]
MNSREKILAELKRHARQGQPLPALPIPAATDTDNVERLKSVLTGIGGQWLMANDWNDIVDQLKRRFPSPSRWVNVVNELSPMLDNTFDKDPHLLENVTLAILKGHFAVAENGAVWMTNERMGDRALPYICEHLAIVINVNDICATMYDAYERIGSTVYGLGAFIAGPSKTADIEQSLVLGAHGPKSMTLILLNSSSSQG